MLRKSSTERMVKSGVTLFSGRVSMLLLIHTVARTRASNPPWISVSSESPTIMQSCGFTPSSSKQCVKIETAGFCSACSPPTTTALKSPSHFTASSFSRCVWASPLVSSSSLYEHFRYRSKAKTSGDNVRAWRRVVFQVL